MTTTARLPYLKRPLNIRDRNLVERSLLKPKNALATETPQSKGTRHEGVRWISSPHGAVAREGRPEGGFPPESRVVVAGAEFGAGRPIVDRIVVRQRGAQESRGVLHVLPRVRLMRVPDQIEVVARDQKLFWVALF